MRSCVRGRMHLFFFVGFAAASVSFSTLPLPRYSCFCSLPCFLDELAETLATQATHHKASKSQEFCLGSERACRDSWKFPEILEKKNFSTLPLKAEFSRIGLVHTTGSPSSKYEHRRPSTFEI